MSASRPSRSWKVLRARVTGTRRKFDAHLTKGLCHTEEELTAQIAGMRRLVDDEKLDKLHAWIHTNLIILDSKAQAILSLYSIALATLTIFYATLDSSAPVPFVVLVFVSFVVIAWSIVPLARVSYIYWSTADEFQDPELLVRNLLRVRDERSRIVRVAVLKGVITLILFTAIVIWDAIRRI